MNNKDKEPPYFKETALQKKENSPSEKISLDEKPSESSEVPALDTPLLPSDIRSKLRRSISNTSLGMDYYKLNENNAIKSLKERHLSNIKTLYQHEHGDTVVGHPGNRKPLLPNAYGHTIMTYGLKTCAAVIIEIVDQNGKCIEFDDANHPTYSLIHAMGKENEDSLITTYKSITKTALNMRDSIKRIYGPEATLKVTVVHNQNNTLFAYERGYKNIFLNGPHLFITNINQIKGIENVIRALYRVGVLEFDNICSFAQNSRAPGFSSRDGITVLYNGQKITIESGMHLHSPESENEAKVCRYLNNLSISDIHYKTVIDYDADKGQFYINYKDFTCLGKPLTEEEKQKLLKLKTDIVLESGYYNSLTWKDIMNNNNVALPEGFLPQLALMRQKNFSRRVKARRSIMRGRVENAAKHYSR